VFLLNAFFLFELNIHNFKIYDFAIYYLRFTILHSLFFFETQIHADFHRL